MMDSFKEMGFNFKEVDVNNFVVDNLLAGIIDDLSTFIKTNPSETSFIIPLSRPLRNDRLEMKSLSYNLAGIHKVKLKEVLVDYFGEKAIYETEMTNMNQESYDAIGIHLYID